MHAKGVLAHGELSLIGLLKLNVVNQGVFINRLLKWDTFACVFDQLLVRFCGFLTFFFWIYWKYWLLICIRGK